MVGHQGRVSWVIASPPCETWTAVRWQCRRAASIFKLAYMKWLQNAPAVALHTYRQDAHGQVSQKMSCFLCLRMKTIDQYLYKFNGGEIKPNQGHLVGKDSNGRYLTAQAKEYPESLNRAIALAAADAIRSDIASRQAPDFDDQDLSCLAEYQRLIMQYDSYVPSHEQKI